MKSTQTGFTIVELMIVVAVIGVLASIALPIYSDYVNRGKVSEAVQLLSGLRSPMQEYYMANGSWPTVDQIGGKTTGVYTSMIVASTDPNELYLEAEMKGGTGTELGGKQLRMVYIEEQKSWNCTVQGANNPISSHYLPSACR